MADAIVVGVLKQLLLATFVVAPGFAQQTPPQNPPQLVRPKVPQPQQKQSLDYFVGRWDFKWTGRESPVDAGSRTGSITIVRSQDSRFLESRTEGRSATGAYRERGMIGFDDEKKMLVWFEHRVGDIDVVSLADWTSPITIRFAVAPITIKGQTFRLRRTISVVSAQTFTVLDELSVEGGAFERLGNGTFSKAEPPSAKP